MGNDSGQDESSKKPMVIQCHWIYGVVAFAELFIAAIILMGFFFLAPLLVERGILDNKSAIIIALTFSVLIFSIFSLGIFQWKFTYYVITKRKVYMVKMARGLSFIFQEAVFQLVKSIEETKPGVLASLLNYGHIKLNTDEISSHGVFYMKFIKNSEQVASHIEQLILNRND